MKNVKRNSRLSKLILMVLIAAMVLSLAACGNEDEVVANAQTKSFIFEVVYPDGSTESFDIESTKSTVGGALMAEGLVQGEDGTYGLYVKTVNGETLDYDTDKMYWAFYENDAYAQAGVDTTEIKADTSYAFKASK